MCGGIGGSRLGEYVSRRLLCLKLLKQIASAHQLTACIICAGDCKWWPLTLIYRDRGLFFIIVRKVRKKEEEKNRKILTKGESRDGK